MIFENVDENIEICRTNDSLLNAYKISKNSGCLGTLQNKDSTFRTIFISELFSIRSLAPLSGLLMTYNKKMLSFMIIG